MIDFIKSNNTGLGPKIVLSNPLLTFPLPINENGGEILQIKRTATFQDLVFIINPSCFKEEENLKIKGSLHKYFNKGEHNANDFSFEELLNVAIDLWQKFKINPFNIILCNLEFGVNLELPYEPGMFINDLLIHKGKPVNITQRSRMLFGETLHNQFAIKIYDKGLQYNCGNILRFELKFLKMEQLNKKGIYKLADLLNLQNWQVLKMFLLREFDELVYYDPSIKIDVVKPHERQLLDEGNNPRFWINLKQQQPKNWTKKKNRFLGLVNKYGSYHFAEIREQIEKKVDELQLLQPESIRKMTVFFDEVKSKNYTQNDQSIEKNKHTVIQAIVGNYTQNDPLLYGHNAHSPYLNISFDLRRCPVTDLNISMQKERSKFITPLGVKWYYENELNIFNTKLLSRIKKDDRNVSLDVLFVKIAHSARNKIFNPHNNPRNNTKRSIQKILSYPVLFDTNHLIKPEKRTIAGFNI